MTITEPTVTGNAVILLGFITARLEEMYRVVEVAADRGCLTVENIRTGNQFVVQVQQIGGVV